VIVGVAGIPESASKWRCLGVRRPLRPPRNRDRLAPEMLQRQVDRQPLRLNKGHILTTMGTPAVRMTLTWRVAQGEATSMTSALQRLMERTRAAPGCTHCSMSTDISTRIEIRYVADWESEHDVQRHIRSSDFTRLAELMEHATEPPTVEFVVPTGICGLEYAEKVRRMKPQRRSAS
jgi:quinol monooxygenase YgiN